MLLQYNVRNFKSFGHPVEFSMFPTQESTDERFLKKIKTKAGEWKVLQRGGFFGPNASGKSSFIESIDFARNFIINGQKSGTTTGVSQFKGDFEDLKGVSVFQFMFYFEGDVFEYGFSIDRVQVHQEWLMQLNEKELEPLFTRITDGQGKTMIDIEDAFAPKYSVQRNLAELLKQSIQENQKNQLFLYKLYDNAVDRVQKVFDWFRHLQIIFPSSTIQALPIKIQQNQQLREYISDKLKSLDTGVFNVSVDSHNMTFEEFAENYGIPAEVIRDMEAIKHGIINIIGKSFIFFDGNLLQIKFEHKLNSKSVKFNIEEESDGTQRLLDLLPMLFSTQEDDNLIYFVDEIDRSLHTMLSQFLLDEFVNNISNRYNQIIFTAHDVNLINLKHFRKEEIWFIEKNSKGESRLNPLSNFVSINKNHDVLKAYLCGRFGAVPTIS